MSPGETPSRYDALSTLRVSVWPSAVRTVIDGTDRSIFLTVTVSTLCRESVTPGVAPVPRVTDVLSVSTGLLVPAGRTWKIFYS